MFYLGDLASFATVATVATGAINGNLKFEFSCDCIAC